VRDHIENLTVNGHNSKIEIASTCEFMVIQGHNNKVFAAAAS
jgi:hypothetical protein